MKFSEQLHYDMATLLAAVPTSVGMLLRRAYYKAVLTSVGKNLVVEYGAIITTTKTQIGNNVWIGPYSIIGFALIFDNVMLASHSCILSKSEGHKEGNRKVKTNCTIISNNVWTGTHCTIMNHVSSHTIIGAGAVVTKSYPAGKTLVGIPARPL